MLNKLAILRDKTIVFAEDDEITREQMSELLKMMFKTVYTACDGEEALGFYEAHSADIILTDVNMPKMDGIKLAGIIREQNQSIPIVLMTSFAGADLIESTANLSVDGFLIKPTALEAIMDTLCKAIDRGQS